MPKSIQELFGIFGSGRKLRESGIDSDPNRSLIKYENNSGISNLDKLKDGESSSFEEAFSEYAKNFDDELKINDNYSNNDELIRDVFRDGVWAKILANPFRDIDSGAIERSIVSVTKRLADERVNRSDASINFINNIKEKINQNMDRVGNLSFGEMFDSAMEIINSTEVDVKPFKLISCGLLYQSIVRLYANVAFGGQADLMGGIQADQMRARNIRAFMIWGALPITLSLMTIINHSPLEAIQIKFGNSSSENDNLMALFFITGQQMFNRNNWGKWIIIAIIVVSILIIIPIEFYAWIYSFLSIKLYLTINLIVIFIIVLNYLLRLSFLLFNDDHVLNIPKKSPKLVKRWLTDLNEQIKTGDREYYISSYVRMSLIYIFVFIFLLLFLYYGL